MSLHLSDHTTLGAGRQEVTLGLTERSQTNPLFSVAVLGPTAAKYLQKTSDLKKSCSSTFYFLSLAFAGQSSFLRTTTVSDKTRFMS